MKRDAREELFFIQVRLFRQFQVERGLTAGEAEAVFKRYDVFEYIETCYEEYHVQGDDADMEDIYRYLTRKGWKV